MSRMDLSENKFETDDDKPFICSCCSERFNTKLSPPFLLLELASSLEYAQAQKADTTAEAVHDDNNEGTEKSDSQLIHSENGCEMETTCSSLRDNAEEDCRNQSKKIVHQSSNATTIEYCCFQQDHSLETIPLPSESGMVCDLNRRLIPVDLIDFSTTLDQELGNSLKYQEQDMRMHQQGEAALLMVNKIAAKTSNGELKSLEIARGFTDDSSVVEVEKRNQDLVGEASDDFVTAPGAQTLLVDTEELTTDKKEPNDPPGTEKL